MRWTNSNSSLTLVYWQITPELNKFVVCKTNKLSRWSYPLIHYIKSTTFLEPCELTHTDTYCTSLNIQIDFSHLVYYMFNSKDFKCDFDDETLCNRCSQSATDNTDWIFHSGSTGTPNTGPNSDHTSGTGKRYHLRC